MDIDETKVNILDQVNPVDQVDQLDQLDQNDKVDQLDQVIDEANDAFSYTKSGKFTSETHKIEVKNLPRHIGYDVSLSSLSHNDVLSLT